MNVNFTAILKAAVLAVVLTSPSYAHQQKAAITSVMFNPRSESIEIVHRFYLHDAEHAMQTMVGPSASIVSDDKVQEAFASYAADSFQISQDGEPIALDLVGYELERAYIYVYQEAPGQMAELGFVTVGFTALHDIWPDQSNLVNIEIGPCLKTVIFDGRTSAADVSLAADVCNK